MSSINKNASRRQKRRKKNDAYHPHSYPFLIHFYPRPHLHTPRLTRRQKTMVHIMCILGIAGLLMQDSHAGGADWGFVALALLVEVS